jgi:hypothetical protein
MIPILGPLFSAIGGAASAVGSAAGAAASGIGSLATSGVSTLGAVGSSALGAAGGVLSQAGELAGGAISTIGGAGQWAIANAPQITEVAGGVYGAYTSYEQAKAARAAAEKLGTQINTVTPTTIPSPAPAATIPTLSYASGGSPPMTEEERLYQEALAQQKSDTGRIITIAIVLIGGYLLLSKKSR